MPIRLPADFPSAEKLNQEGVFTHTYERAFSQEIRPLKIALLNLMPTKIDTEVQLLRLLSLSSIQIEPLFLKTSSHQTKYGAEHLDKFYVDFPSISNQRFDAIIITGAPLEQLDFEQVDYWDELVEVVHWANDNVFAELFICWGAQAGLYIDFGIQKTMLEQKLFGVFDYTTSGQHRLTRGFDDVIRIPQSRFSELNHSDLAKVIASGKLIPLLTDTHGTPNIITTPHTHKTYLLGHLEYDRETLDIEYRRDLAHAKNSQYSVVSSQNEQSSSASANAFSAGGDSGSAGGSSEGVTAKPTVRVHEPQNYYPQNNLDLPPICTWRAHAHLFFSNWVDYVYQETPYDLDQLKPCLF